MERINKNTVMPGRTEVLEHEEVFGVPFGAAATVKQTMGARSRPAENPGSVCIHFRTGNVTETNVGYSMVMSVMAMAILKGVYTRMISTKPWAHIGDPENVVEGSCMTFISANGKDPRTNMFQTGYVMKPGGGMQMVRTAVPPRPDGGLRPNTDYYFTQRALRDDGDIVNISNVQYKGSDDFDHGGELLLIDAPAVVEPTAADIDGVMIEMMDMVIMGIPGLWTPIEP